MNGRIDLPLLDDETKDERFPGVHLLSTDENTKTTAEEFPDHWLIRDWEIFGAYWFCRVSYSIDFDLIGRLWGLASKPMKDERAERKGYGA